MNPQTPPPINGASFEKLLDAVVSSLPLGLTRRQREQLRTHFTLLLQWNAKINLTSIRSPEEIATRHFEESLLLATLIPAPSGPMVDIGSGAGFPGLPLKIAWPDVETILLEPNHKKSTFLKEVARSSGLEGIEVRAERLEQVVEGGLAGRAALATLRAVALTPKVLKDAAKLLTNDGQIALFTSEEGAASLPGPGIFRWHRQEAIPHSRYGKILIGRRPADSV